MSYIQEAEKLLQQAVNAEDLREAVKLLKDSILILLKGFYKTDNVKEALLKYLQDIVKSREYVLALYILIPLFVESFPDVLKDAPEDIVRLYLSNMIVLYEKSRQILGIM